MIKNILDRVGLDSILQHADEKTPQERLMVYGGKDSHQRDLHMVLTAQTIEMSQQVSKDSDERAKAYVRIQLDANFPFLVEDMAMAETAQFLHLLNLQVEVPGFYLNYLDNTILYRYVLLADREHIPQKILLSIIGVAMFFQDVFGQALERLAKGQVTFVELLQEIQKSLKS